MLSGVTWPRSRFLACLPASSWAGLAAASSCVSRRSQRLRRVNGIATEAGNRVGDITVSGTLELVIFVGLFSGIFGALAYLFTEPWLQWAGRWRTLLFAVGLLVAASPVAIDPENVDFAILRNRPLNVAMFASLFLAFGLLMGPLVHFIERWLVRVGTGGPVFTMTRASAVDPPGVAVLLLLGSLISLGFGGQYLLEDACGCDVRFTTEVFLVAIAATTVMLWALLSEDHVNMRRLRFVRVAGYVALSGAVGTGAFRLIGDVREIL